MTYSALITVDNRQTAPNGQSEHIVSTYNGSLHEKDEMLIAGYREETEDDVLKCLLKFSNDRIELKKNGKLSYQMTFKAGEPDTVMYHTPYGVVPMGVCTKSLNIGKLRSDGFEAGVEYTLDMGGDYMIDCEMQIRIEIVEE